MLADPASNNGGLDGIVMAPDGSLIVNNWRLARLARVAVAPDGKPGAVTVIQTSRPLEIPDGMRHVGGQRYVVAEGTGKVALLVIDGDKARVRTIGEGFSSVAGLTIEKNIVWHVPGEFPYIFNPQKRLLKPPLPFRLSPTAAALIAQRGPTPMIKRLSLLAVLGASALGGGAAAAAAGSSPSRRRRPTPRNAATTRASACRRASAHRSSPRGSGRGGRWRCRRTARSM